MIDQTAQVSSCAADQTYLGKGSVTSDPMVESKGSQLPVCDFESPFPTSVSDVSMEPPADKRSRESPDSTLKPEHKSLKTSGVAVATEAPIAFSASATPDTAVDQSGPKPLSIRWNVRKDSEVRQTMFNFITAHQLGN